VKKIRIVHIINSFEFGGAEAMLVNLLLRTDTDRFEPSVVALIDDMSVAAPIIQAGIPIEVVGMTSGLPDPRKVLKLAGHLRKQRPQVIQTWMDHSNLIGSVAARMAGSAKVVWGIHHSNHIPGVAKRTTLMTVDACAKLSRWLPAGIVCCSEYSAECYTARGFDRRKIEVIPNGFDTSRFSPDPQARDSVRRELRIPMDALLIGLVARWDPFKDHATFFRAAAELQRARRDVHFLLCGAGITADNADLMALLRENGLERCCHLLGPRRDVPRIHAALDLLASSSISEAFPLTIGESMACGTPVVATDVGDSALIIGDTGRVVPPQQPAALAAAWGEILTLPAAERISLGLRGRRRVCDLFDLGAVTRRYESLYGRLVAGRSAPAATLAAATQPADAGEGPVSRLAMAS
jgi:glycosyltransferase involved in cell wall biosynthesis